MLLKTVSLEKAQLLLRWAYVLKSLIFILPTVTLFYQYKGLTVGDFFLIQGIFAFTSVVAEIPTGYVGDLFSRKKVIVISFLIYFLGYLVWYLFDGFWFIMLGEMCFGLSVALYSGTGEAYLYDILKKQKHEDDIIKELGVQGGYATWGAAVATFCGGFMYHKLGPDMTVLCETISIFLGLIMVLFLPDIPDVRRVVSKGKSKWKDILEITHYASTHHEIKWLMLYPAAFGAGTLILMWGMQPIMEKALVPTALFGVFMGIQQFSRGTFSSISHFLFRKLKTNLFAVCLFVILFLGLGVASFLPTVDKTILIYCGLALMGIFSGSISALNVVTSSMINHRIKSDERATVLSVKAMFSRIFTGTAMIALKFMIDGCGLQITFATVGAVILILTAIALFKLLRLKL